jgi:aspartyl-tRNA(Asn)/glutamyl-tRNA(Gln) amidotransferase subunit A
MLPKSIAKLNKSFRSGDLTPVEALENLLRYINKPEISNLNAFNYTIPINDECAFKSAEESVNRFKSSSPLSPLDGVTITFKDNYLVRDMPTTAGSRILSGFLPPIDSTLAKRWRQAGAIIIGKTSMDEFGMGSFNFYADKVPVNPINEKLVVGGSSGGAAVAVASHQGYAAFATDTGGSITFPAHWWGIYGFKPSYGRLSRSGVILYSSSNDTPGIMAKSIEEIENVFDVVDGEDEFDSNSLSFESSVPITSLKGLRIGVAKEFNIEELPQERIDEQLLLLEILQDRGAEIVEVSIPLLKQILPVYYTIIPAEATSNLSRYDGLKYGLQKNTISDDVLKISYEEYIRQIRTEGFGVNVKRRIALGNFVLSTQDVDYNEMFIKAQKIRRLFCQQYNDTMKEVDILISPNAVGDIPTVEEVRSGKIDAIVGEYSQDYFTVPSNVCGAPSLCLPLNKESVGERAMYKLWGKYGYDKGILQIGRLIDAAVKEA